MSSELRHPEIYPSNRRIGQRVIKILRQNGPFLVLHLRFEMDMLAFTGCTKGCTDEEAEELTRMRYAYPWWKEKLINSDLKMKAGLCPLTLLETALVLRALDVDRSVQKKFSAGKREWLHLLQLILMWSGRKRSWSLQILDYSRTIHLKWQLWIT